MKRIICMLVCALLLIPQGVVHGAGSAGDVTIALTKDLQDRLEPLIKEYEALSGTAVRIEYYESDADYRTAINTQILAGGGPDLFLGTKVPYWEYARKGLLADVGELLNKSDFSADMAVGVIDPLRDGDGKLYILPCSYNFYVVMINRELAARYGIDIPSELTFYNIFDMILEFGEKAVKDTGVYGLLGGAYYIQQLMLNEILARIDFPAGEHNVASVGNDLLAYINSVSEMPTDYMYEPPEYFCIIAYAGNGDVYKPAVGNLIMNDTFVVEPMPRVDEGDLPLFEPDRAFCISKRGNVEGAWGLLQYFLDAEVQTASASAFPNPIRTSAAEARLDAQSGVVASAIESAEKGTSNMAQAFPNLVERAEFEAALERYIAKFSGMLDSEKQPLLTDPTLSANILDIITAANSESIASGETKKGIISAVDIYINETGGDVSSGYLVLYIVAGVVLLAGGVFVIRAVVRRGKGKTG